MVNISKPPKANGILDLMSHVLFRWRKIGEFFQKFVQKMELKTSLFWQKKYF